MSSSPNAAGGWAFACVIACVGTLLSGLWVLSPVFAIVAILLMKDQAKSDRAVEREYDTRQPSRSAERRAFARDAASREALDVAITTFKRYHSEVVRDPALWAEVQSQIEDMWSDLDCDLRVENFPEVAYLDVQRRRRESR